MIHYSYCSFYSYSRPRNLKNKIKNMCCYYLATNIHIYKQIKDDDDDDKEIK